MSTDEGLAEFYDAVFDDAYRAAVRLTRGERAAAEDLVHEAFVALLSAIDAGRVEEAGVGFMITTIRRRFLNSSRSQTRERRRVDLFQRTRTASDSSARVSGPDLSGLAPRERAALIFRYVDNLSVPEVAELLGTSVRATESLLQRAKRKARRAQDRDR